VDNIPPRSLAKRNGYIIIAQIKQGIMDPWAILQLLLSAAIGSGITIVAVVTWLGDRLAERLSLKWKHKYDKEIELLRNQLSTTQDLLHTALESASQAHLRAQDRILNTLEELWTNVLTIREFGRSWLGFYDLLAPKEYHYVFEKAMLPRMSQDEFIDSILKQGVTLERHRPFLGERLWTLFSAYRVLVGRLCFKVVLGKGKGQLQTWDTDEFGKRDDLLLGVLRGVLTEDELAKATRMEVGAPSTLMILIEQKILREAESRITGKQVAEISADEAKRLSEAMSPMWEAKLLKGKRKPSKQVAHQH